MSSYFSKARDPISSITHLYGAVLSGVATILLLYKTIAISQISIQNILSSLLFGASLIALYTASAIYHFSNGDHRKITALRKVDHAMIYVLIAGTYTPILLSYLPTPNNWIFTTVIWSCAIGGILMKLFWFGAPRWLQTTLYIAMGWAIIFDFSAVQSMSIGAVSLLVAGGVSYTIGGIIYMFKKPNFTPKFGFHELFHIFVLLGSVFHFFMVYIYVA